MFGVYALAVLVGLLFLGRLSDHVGRRPVPVATPVPFAVWALSGFHGSLGPLSPAT